MMRATIGRRIGNQPQREYIVTYTDDAPARAEAIAFFWSLRRPPRFPLVEAIPLPKEIDDMPLVEAQKYLDLHPTPRLWEQLTVDKEADLLDADLERLQHIPELKRVGIFSSCVTDVGIRHLRLLHSVEQLWLYSGKLTDACLEDIVQLKSLRSLDMQGSPGVSRSAFFATIQKLPAIVDSYPPRSDPCRAA